MNKTKFMGKEKRKEKNEKRKDAKKKKRYALTEFSNCYS